MSEKSNVANTDVEKRDFARDVRNATGSARTFFQHSFHDAHARHAVVRGGISGAVRGLLIEWNPATTPAIAENLQKLKDTRVAVVVTGQQLGLLGGPAFTLYKVLTAVKVAEALEKERGHPVVPIFWMQSEDHDYAEIEKSVLLDGVKQPFDIRLPIAYEKRGDSVGNLVVEQAAHATLLHDIEQWRHSFGEKLMPELDAFLAHYQPGKNIATIWRELCQKFFAYFGVLVLDPLHPTLKKLAAPLFERALLEWGALEKALRVQSDRIEAAGYATQVKIKEGSPLLFFNIEGKRIRGEIRGSDFVFGDKRFPVEAVLALVKKTPELFTTSALFRPLYQDTLLPTLAYVAGPAELTYWAQITPLYSHFGVTQPLVIPRASFAVLENKSAEFFKIHHLTLETAKNDVRTFIHNLMVGTRADLTPRIDQTLHAVKALLAELTSDLTQSNQRMQRWTQKTEGSVLRSLRRLHSKYLTETSIKERELSAGYLKLQSVLYPRGEPQERVISAAYFLGRHGEQFLKAIYQAIEPYGGGQTKVICTPLS
jgi:bacillithiol biosynthesis cysteine-adding enzyme BshC